MAPIQTPQRLNRLVEHIAEWPELSGTESKGSRGRPSQPANLLQFFLIFSQPHRIRSHAHPGYWDPSYR